MPTLDEVKAQLRNLGTVNKIEIWFGVREIKAFPDILQEDEVLERVLQGKRGTLRPIDGLLCATNKRLVFVDRGVINVKVEDFSYNEITSINTYGTDRFFGRVTISFASGIELDVRRIEKKHVEDFGDYVRARIKMSTMSITGQSKQADISEKDKVFDSDNERKLNALERLVKLKEQGILSEAELEIEKKKIMKSK